MTHINLEQRYGIVSNADVVFYSGNFSIANQQPLITEFTILSPIIGDGSSSTQRMWFNTPADGTLEFRYSVSDDDFDRASLSNAPGPGSPALDSGNSLNYGWTEAAVHSKKVHGTRD